MIFHKMIVRKLDSTKIFKILFFVFIWVSITTQADSLEKDQNLKNQTEAQASAHRPKNWIEWLGNFHLLFIHFPIALIWTVAISDLFYRKTHSEIFNMASRVMLMAAALFSIPTVFFGLILKLATPFEGIEEKLIFFHMLSGLITAFYALFIVYIRETSGFTRIYGVLFAILLILVTITGYLGGELSFGYKNMYFPAS